MPQRALGTFDRSKVPKVCQAGPSGAVPVGGEQSETTALLRRAAGAVQAGGRPCRPEAIKCRGVPGGTQRSGHGGESMMLKRIDRTRAQGRAGSLSMRGRAHGGNSVNRKSQGGMA